MWPHTRSILSELNIQRDRDSQDSKVTSTPRTMSPVLSLSPSVSSIANEDVSMAVDSDMDSSFQTTSIAGHAELSSLSEDSDHQEPPRKKTKRVPELKWTGVWSSLKPKNKDGLFFKLTTQPTEIENIVADLVKFYISDEKAGVVTILQLFVDLCGYKKLKVATHQDLLQQDLAIFVKKMENEFIDAELKKTGKFVFMKCSRLEASIDKILSKFVKELVMISYKTNVLFDNTFTNHLFECLNLMAFSNVRFIKVMGIILVTKFLTALIKLYHKYLLDPKEHTNSSASASMTVNEKRAEVESYIDFLYIIFDKNCLIPDKQCYIVKVMCAQEICHWIKAFPEMFILKRKCLGRLLKLVQDRNETVRRSAISTCEELIKDGSIAVHMKERIELYLKIISTRIMDVSYNLAAKAIGIFTLALNTYSMDVIKSYKMLIIYRMFEPNVVSAKAAGKFLACYLQLCYGEPAQLLLILGKIVHLRKEFAERLPFFLAAIIPFFPQLQDWGVIVDCLLNDEHTFSARKRLLAVLNECVRFACTGKFSKNRQVMFEEKLPDEVQLQSVVNVIIRNFEPLMFKFQSDKTCLKQITEMLTFMNCNFILMQDLQAHLTKIFRLLKDLFNATTDKALLEDITTIFSSFCEKHDYAVANTVAESIKTTLAKSLLSDLSQLSPETSRSSLLRLRGSSMKISVLFAKFNLTNILKWEDIYQAWSNYLKALKYLIVCCKWHLVWSFKQFMRTADNENDDQNNHFLYINIKDFVYSCLDLLQKCSGTDEAFFIFNEFCDLYAIFEEHLRRRREFSHYVIQVTERNYQEILMNFCLECVIENTKLHLEQRQKYLCKVVEVINLGVIPVDNFAKILRYYHSHHVEFGPILTSVLQDLYVSHPALPVVVLHTLVSMYDTILEKYTVVEIKSDESKQLKLLSKKITELKEMKFHNIILKLVNMSINFGLKSDKNYPFLYFARYFAKLLNESGKNEAYDVFKSMVPEQDKSDNFILLFASDLKPSM